MSDFIEGCTICGREFQDGDKAYATKEGAVFTPVSDRLVFEPSEAPHLTVACEDCGLKCSEAIANIPQVARPDRERQLLQVIRDTEYALATGGPDMDMGELIATLQGAMRRATTNEEALK